MFALSTSWNSWKHHHAKEIISEIKPLGFKTVELNFSLSQPIVNGMIKLKKQGLINVVSLHNFCPIPNGTSADKASPDIFSLSAISEARRKQALRYTKKTIDTASEIDAKVVILHLGRVEIREQIRKLAFLYFSGKKQKYKQLKAQMLKARKAKSAKFFSQTLRSLDELCAYAQRKKIKLGVENRYYFREIPIAEEMEIILNEFPQGPLYYWHDTGHAQVYENIGFIRHEELLGRFAGRMIGIHLHDIEGIDDHRAPLAGKFDFTRLLPYIKKKTIKIIEAHHPATAEEIIKARDYLRKIFSK